MKLTNTHKIIAAAIGLFLLARSKASASTPAPVFGAPADVDMRNMSLPRGMRNNNPGNLKYFGIGWQGEVGSDGTFSIFSKYKYGIRAMLKDIQGDYRNKGKTTLQAIINEFAPGSENPTSSYIAKVVEWSGINANVPFLDNYQNWKDIVLAMTRFENGRVAVTPAQFDQVWTEFNF